MKPLKSHVRDQIWTRCDSPVYSQISFKIGFHILSSVNSGIGFKGLFLDEIAGNLMWQLEGAFDKRTSHRYHKSFGVID